MPSTVIKFRGIIIKETPVGESDKYLTIFTKTGGKLIVRARGSKNAKSKYITAQLFSYCDFMVYQGKGFYSLTQVDLIESFYNLRLDYDSLMAAYEIITLVDKYVPTGPIEAQESQDILLLILKALSQLAKKPDKKTISSELAVMVFQLKFLQLQGFAPSMENGQLQGPDHSIIISPGAMQAIDYIMCCEIGKVYDFIAAKDIEYDLSRVCKIFLPKLEG